VVADKSIRDRWSLVGLGIGGAIVAAILAYSVALSAPFQFDDAGSITTNRTIERLWPLSTPLRPPPGVAVSGRPVVNYSLAVDHAVNRALGVDQGADSSAERTTVAYRLTNLLFHLACAMLLLGVLRRTLRSPALPTTWTTRADAIAALVTTLWLLHPIQSEVVDYVTQRTESIVSICYLGALYASIRAWDAATRRRTISWCAVAVVACAAGMASKEVMLTAPVMIVLYDRAFRVSSWRGLLERRAGRPWLYLALVATCTVAFALITRGARSDTVGFHLGVAWYEYMYSQAWAILHYLRLVLWPDPLTFDYGRNPIGGFRGVPGMIVLTAAVVATVVAWRHRPWLGFAGAWFFLLLAPSSSVVPIRTEIAAERRIYLALASILVLGVVVAEWLRVRALTSSEQRRRWKLGVAIGAAVVFMLIVGGTATRLASALQSTPAPAALWMARVLIGLCAAALMWHLVFAARRWPYVVVLALALAAATQLRSRTYNDPESLWRGAVASVPTNARAYDNLAAAILKKSASRAQEAESLLTRAIALDSTYFPAWRNLATVVAQQGRLPEAEALLERLVAIGPNYADGLERLGTILVAMGRPDRALPPLERAASLAPHAAVHVALGSAYVALGRADDAAGAFRHALQLDPSRDDARVLLGGLLSEQGRAADALPYLEEAVRRQPSVGYGFGVLSLVYAQLGRAADADAAARSAVQHGGDDSAVLVLCGRAMSLVDRHGDAERLFDAAVRLDPRNPEALTRYGMTERQLGKPAEAEQLFRRALTVQPDYVPAQRGLESLRNSPHR
jgi:tetratricopeptide (TPR) repeat protein